MSPATPGPVWQARTGTPPADPLVAFGDSTAEDQALIAVDLAGSVAHAAGLAKAGILGDEEARELIAGLQQLWGQAQAGQFPLDPALEDVHMNVEHQLGELIGPLAGKLHTGRSRNDQVALDTLLHTRLALVHLADGCHAVATELASLAHEHAATPWAATTHGQAAQPATLGYLLHAHALRFTDLAQQALTLLAEMDESPLGSGAVAGTTLPIEPGFTAGLLGLAPPKNGLLATGARDQSQAVTHLVARIGTVSSSLAQDLFDLHNDGLVTLPDDHTTGSSMMPHKRNPDAAELVRAKATSLIGPATQVTSLLSGLGLGYQRDLQVVKAHLLQALSGAQTILDLLAGLLPGLQADTQALAGTLEAPGLTATDATEALVAQGLPFREAYKLLATAHARTEGGTGLEQALLDQGLEPPLVEAALAAMDQGPEARTTQGGPAPALVEAATTELLDQLEAQAQAIVTAEGQAQMPIDLLSTSPRELVPDDQEVA